MANGRDTLCFTCGLPFGSTRLNHLANGEVCPSCRDRLLDALPAPFPGVAHATPDPSDEPFAAPEAVDETVQPQRELARLERPAPVEDYGPEPA